MNIITIPNGQHTQANYICVNCRRIASMPGHYPDCTTPEVYAIPAHARAPRKRASERKWKDFFKMFVYAKPEGYWSRVGECWWWQKIGKYEQQPKR
jgi:hypothetical protein